MSEAASRGGAYLSNRLGVRQIERNDRCAAAERANLELDVPRSRFVLPIGHRDIGSRTSGRKRNGLSNSAGGTRHEHGASREHSLIFHRGYNNPFLNPCDCS